jgi:hypothetical protein
VRSPKRRFTQELHGATSQKTAFFIVTAVKTSNLTQCEDVAHSLWPQRKTLCKTYITSVTVFFLAECKTIHVTVYLKILLYGREMCPTDWKSEEKITRIEFQYSRCLQTKSENKNEERINKICNKKPTKQSAEMVWLYSMNGGKITENFVKLVAAGRFRTRWRPT